MKLTISYKSGNEGMVRVGDFILPQFKIELDGKPDELMDYYKLILDIFSRPPILIEGKVKEDYSNILGK